MMNHENLELENLSKIFQFETVSRDIDSISSVQDLKNIAKYFLKMYYKQQELLQAIPCNFSEILSQCELDEE